MVPDLTLETIYYNVSTDFKMEFALCGICNVRYLSSTVTDKKNFLYSLKKSASRSRVILTVGGFNQSDNLPKTLAKSLGLELADVASLEALKNVVINSSIPKDAIPLINTADKLCGFVIENQKQSIIMLTEDKAERFEVIENLVLPYLKLLLKKDRLNKNGSNEDALNSQKVPPETETTINNPEPKPESKILTSLLELEGKGAANATSANAAAAAITAAETVVAGANKAAADVSAIDTTKLSRRQRRELGLLKGGAKEDIPTAPQDSQDYIGRHNKAGEVIEPPITPNIAEPLDNIEPKNEEENTQNETIPEPKEPPKKITDTPEPLELVTEESPPEPATEQPKPTKTTEPKDNPNILPLNQQDYTVNILPTDESLPNLFENTKKSALKGRIVKSIIAVILALLLVVGAYSGYLYLYQPMQADTIYKSIVSLYGEDSSIDGLPDNMLPVFSRLYKMNKSIAGFITVPNTNINYPVVTTNAAGAVYCDSHLFDGTLNNFGTPYTFENTTGTRFNRNIIIYGKTTSTGKMFSNISNYKTLNFYRNNPIVTFNTPYKLAKYKVFGLIEQKKGDYNFKQTTFFDDQDFDDYLKKVVKASLIRTTVDVAGTDQIITLCTKEGPTTLLLFARLIRENEDSLVDVSESSLNINASMPETADSSSKYSGGIIENGKNNISGGKYEQSQINSNLEILPNVSTSSILSSVLPSSNPLLSSSYIEPSSSSQLVNSAVSQNGLPTLYVTNASDGDKRISGSAEDILARVVEAEMGSSYQPEALKAQAVCAYSWLLCSGAADGKSYPSVPMKTASSKSVAAVKAVRGIVAVYGGKIAQTFYFDTSAGKTANATDIWGGTYPYLKSVDSSVDKNSAAFASTNTYKAADIATWVKNSQFNIDLTKISDKTQWFKPVYDENGLYVKEIYIGGVWVRGSHLRTYILTAGNCGSGKGLRSPCYTISYNAANDTFTFNVKGYGHGVGLSQTGANEYAKNGNDYQSILKHYFTGITLGTYFE